MEQLERDITKCLYYLKRHKLINYDGNYDACFSFTNESLYLYYPYFNLEDARVLTVAGSGDHVLEAINRGSKDITAFDINRFTFYLTALKIGALQGLSQKEFLRFFNCVSSRSYQVDTYQKIAPYLKQNVRLFWDSIFQQNFQDGEIQTCFFYNGYPGYVLGEGSYLETKQYEQMKEKVSDVHLRFMHVDLLNLPLKLERNKLYDVMFLSNIYDWLPDSALKYGNKNNRRDSFEYFVEHELAPFLTENGKCVFYAALWGKGWDFKNPCLYQDGKPLAYVYTKKEKSDKRCAR